MAPSTAPEPKAVRYSELERLTAHAKHDGEALSPHALGRLLVEALTELSNAPENDSAASDSQLEGILKLAVLTLQTVNSLTEKPSELTLLWNDELDADVFLSRTLLLADHVFVPDLLLSAASNEPTNRSLREAARKLLKHRNLLAAGLVIPIPNGVARAVHGDSVRERTAQDLSQQDIVDFIRTQLILEGPTAREVIFATAKDDREVFAKMFFHGRIETNRTDKAGGFGVTMLHAYEHDYDYSSWIRKVENDAVSYYAQRTNERLVSADLFGAQYVSASPFEARLLQRRTAVFTRHPAQAAVWADVPLLGDLSSAGLAALLRNEEPIENLRAQVRTAMVSAKEPGQDVSAISQLTHEIESASHTLEKRIKTNRLYSGFFPAAASLGGLMVASAGELPGILGAALGGFGSLMPYLGTRVDSRRDASYLYVAARKIHKKESRKNGKARR
ncbi:hypothetical protein QFZ23_003643 [Arthrobacter globiformis]|uniref:hypothetical protein n=1 Tax=Arthrobacter globiformis TaxID=1665 RepID=UPI002781C51D|nr:hypothetical protein [Arthrobacter globiformis]MDQ1059742.1 hypothetical protein [Arthrobacter globiformis]